MKTPKLIVIGASRGGIEAVRKILDALPVSFPAAVAIVLHRSADSSEALVSLVQKEAALPVTEPDDKEKIIPGRIYLAPSDYHLLIEADWFALSTDDPVNFARPSIDVLFSSAVEAYGGVAAGVILTGTGHDGALGLKAIKAQGGITIVQDPETAESSEMPLAAIQACGEVDAVLLLDRIGSYLVQHTQYGSNAL